MPIYEYRCRECGHELEKLQRMSDAPLKVCPQCEEPALRRLVSAAGFRLKGSGWYETDFKQGQKRNLADSGNEKPAAGKPGATDTGSKPAESKPKTESKSGTESAGSSSK
jgi:putative FmdB family regulatory protein